MSLSERALCWSRDQTRFPFASQKTVARRVLLAPMTREEIRHFGKVHIVIHGVYVEILIKSGVNQA